MGIHCSLGWAASTCSSRRPPCAPPGLSWSPWHPWVDTLHSLKSVTSPHSSWPLPGLTAPLGGHPPCILVGLLPALPSTLHIKGWERKYFHLQTNLRWAQNIRKEMSWVEMKKLFEGKLWMWHCLHLIDGTTNYLSSQMGERYQGIQASLYNMETT